MESIDLYAYMEINKSDWFKMTKEQRRVHLKKVSQAAVSNLALAADVDSVSSSVGIPVSVLKGVWNKSYCYQLMAFVLLLDTQQMLRW